MIVLRCSATYQKPSFGRTSQNDHPGVERADLVFVGFAYFSCPKNHGVTLRKKEGFGGVFFAGVKRDLQNHQELEIP